MQMGMEKGRFSGKRLFAAQHRQLQQVIFAYLPALNYAQAVRRSSL